MQDSKRDTDVKKHIFGHKALKAGALGQPRGMGRGGKGVQDEVGGHMYTCG